jgi:hypothetical protein
MIRLIPKDMLLEVVEGFIEAGLVSQNLGPEGRAHKSRSNVNLD